MADLTHLASVAARLHAVTTELDDVLRTIQDQLNALEIGVVVWVGELASTAWRDVIVDEAPTSRREYEATELGYGRLDEDWGLIIRTRRHVEGPDALGFPVTEIYIDDPHPKPLLGASRELRVQAIALLPSLIEAIEREASTAIQRIEEAKAAAALLADGICRTRSIRGTARR